MMTLIGWICLLGGTVALIYVAWVTWKQGQLGTLAIPQAETVPDTRRSDRLAHNASMDERLDVVEGGQVVQMMADLDSKGVVSGIDLHELFKQSEHAPWQTTGNISRVVLLTGGVYIFKVPETEGGKHVWYQAEVLDSLPLHQFYIGDTTTKGPARLFRENDQSQPVPYELPQRLTSGVTWEVIDIGAFKAEVRGKNDLVKDGDQLYFVTSRERGGDRVLLYLDARKGEARGSGGLFVCTPFSPSADVMDLF
jgi:hypothetical protein